MKILFQTKKLNVEQVLESFTSKNDNSGAVISFLGKVRPSRNKKKIKSMNIEIYEEMALYQTRLALKNLLKKFKIHDYLIMHRYGNLKPGENIIFVIVASKHRKEGFVFIQQVLLYFKKKITFWKKENYAQNSKWLDSQN
jgi:molybdopterin synthase catalytic subunit